jgi:phospholysine phosphohistidine inorganic pyrophosphate phosphatase
VSGADTLHPKLRGLRAIAFDLDGVLYEGDRPIPGAAQTVAAVRARGLSVRFVTNTTSLSRRLIADKLARLGFEAHASELFCPARAAAAWLLREELSASFFVAEAALEDFENVTRDDERPDAVVVGDLESDWTFETLNRAFRLVHERDAQLVGLGRTRYWKGPHGLLLDVGPFLAALEQATGKTAVVFGKPEPAFFAALVDDLDQPPDRVAMIGDDIATDVGAAMRAGLMGVLVRTGKFDPRDLDGSIRPDLVIDSVTDLLEI